jgi:uncharacterized damage-inducible protein DinB
MFAMNAMDILERLDEVRVRLLEAISPLPDEALTQPGTVGEWSLADLLAHFVNWEAELVTGLNQIDQGRNPVRLLEALADRQAYNAERASEMKGRELDRIFDDLQGVRLQLEEWLESFSEADLQDRGRVRGAKEMPLWRIIAAASFEHEEEHMEAVEAFAEAWLAREERTIGLNEIEVNQNGNGT